MSQCSRIPLKIKLDNGVSLDGAIVLVEGKDTAKIFLKSTSKELSFETDLLFMDSPTEDMLKAEISESLQDLVNWAKEDFPVWIKEYMEVDESSQLTIKEISRLWSMKQMYFGMFRIAFELGVTTSRIPSDSKVIDIKSVEVGQMLTYSIKG